MGEVLDNKNVETKTGWLSKFLSVFIAPDYKKDTEWKESEEWYKIVEKNILETEDVDSKAIEERRDIGYYLNYARERYEEENAAFNDLDSKADRVLAFSGSMAAAIFVIIRTTDSDFGKCLAFSYAMFLIAMILLLILRWPKPIQSPHKVMLFLDEQSEYTDTVLKLKIIASYHCSTIAHRIINSWKAEVLIKANILLCLGIVFLFIGLLITQ
ncbi:hypothetical protein Enr10x_21470 [Gimesia panareensis]|uniref:Uncharacterized protein n=2 Tax=Gimesia panareensis TaxID=2527978 RepID=A0A517Q5F4_9PLAN|nr:hypothetical protein Enr10x_21470 [Gimesia panareensis]